jgi:hypothetical protein
MTLSPIRGFKVFYNRRYFLNFRRYQKTHKPRYCEKEKDKANKRILRNLSFDNNGLVKPSCGTVALSIQINMIKQKQYIYCYFHDICAKKMFEQKRFAGRHLLTFESQKLNYFGKKVGGPTTVVHRNESVLKNIFKRGYKEIRDRKLLEILKKDRTWLKYELHCNAKTIKLIKDRWQDQDI